MNRSPAPGVRTILAMLACAAGGAALTAALLLPRDRADAPPMAVPPAEPDPATRPPQPAREAGDLAAMHTALAAVHERLRGLEGKVEAALATRTVAGTEHADVPLAIDPAVLQAAMQRAIVAAEAEAKQAKLAAMQPHEVLRAAMDLVDSKSDVAAGREMLEALLQRQLTPEERRDATTQLGIAQRVARDYGAARASLQSAIEQAGGVGTKAGAWAAFQMAWTHQHANDPVGARQWFEQAGRSAGADPALRIEGRWHAARLGEASDPGVRAELEALLREIDGSEQFAKIAADVKQRLARR